LRIDPSTHRDASVIRRKLLVWYDATRRDLPWRKNRDPYRVWISEVMLQQTRVDAVIPYYERFLRRFPSVHSLAQAPENDVLAHWSGLGYYSRARNLHKAAGQIVDQNDGVFPRDEDDALALPGIGAYTAAAVLSIAYGVRLPVVDGNVARVLSRLLMVPADVRSGAGKKVLLNHAAVLLSRRRPGDFNQALMELGATVCTPQNPKCETCPVRAQCGAFLHDQVHAFPPVNAKAPPKVRNFSAAIIENAQHKILLMRRPSTAAWMPGFWELPSAEAATNGDPLLGQHIVPLSLLGRIRHTITTNKIEVAVFYAKLARPVAPPDEQWTTLRQMDGIPVTTITRKALRLLNRS
jgi:A/G-specific adenine glycosylase